MKPSDPESRHDESGTLTKIVNGEQAGDFEAIYQELRTLVSATMRRNNRPRTASGDLGLTTLVHETWIKLQKTERWDSRAHYFGSAARAVRQILVDHSAKRRVAVSLEHDPKQPSQPEYDRCIDYARQIHEALIELEKVDPRCSRVAELRIFGEVPIAAISSLLGVSERTVARDWRFSRAWIGARLHSGDRL